MPKSLPQPTCDPIYKPVIRIASVQEPPERIVIDTSQPTIVPPPTLAEPEIPNEPTPLPSYAPAPPPASPTAVDVDKKKRKVTKRQAPKEEPKVAANQPPLPSTPAVANGGSATTAPLIRLSFTDIISGQLVRNLLNLH